MGNKNEYELKKVHYSKLRMTLFVFLSPFFFFSTLHELSRERARAYYIPVGHSRRRKRDKLFGLAA